MRDHAASGMLRSPPIIPLVPSTQEAPEITAPTLVCPDHLMNPFWDEREAAVSPQPKAELLRTPPFRSELPGQCATDSAGHIDGLRFVIWPNDHASPHVHVLSADAEATIALGAPGGYPRLRENRRMRRVDLVRAL